MKRRLDLPFENKTETTDSLAKMHGQKKMLKQRLDFPFHNKFETIDIIPKMDSQKTAKTTVRFSISKQVSSCG